LISYPSAAVQSMLVIVQRDYHRPRMPHMQINQSTGSSDVLTYDGSKEIGILQMV